MTASPQNPSRDVSLRDRRILVVEDWVVVAMELRRMLIDMGCDVVGPAYDIPEALRLATTEKLHGAILDLNLHGREVYPVADALQERSVPLIFISGYENRPAKYSLEPFLEKPFEQRQLERIMRETFVSSSTRT